MAKLYIRNPVNLIRIVHSLNISLGEFKQRNKMLKKAAKGSEKSKTYLKQYYGLRKIWNGQREVTL